MAVVVIALLVAVVVAVLVPMTVLMAVTVIVGFRAFRILTHFRLIFQEIFIDVQGPLDVEGVEIQNAVEINSRLLRLDDLCEDIRLTNALHYLPELALCHQICFVQENLVRKGNLLRRLVHSIVWLHLVEMLLNVFCVDKRDYRVDTVVQRNISVGVEGADDGCRIRNARCLK